MTRYRSWGMRPKTKQSEYSPGWISQPFPLNHSKTSLAFGNGRSYGDSCFNSSGALIDTQYFNHFINFDSELGILRCESGVLFSDILRVIVPKGWFLPVTPGTKFVTLGGAIANDVHGKNHHKDGSFGCHVRCFELIRSDGQKLLCSSESNLELFRATIGGLGLTGVITWAEIQLFPIQSPQMDTCTTPFSGLEEFLELSKRASEEYQYSVAWLDCSSSGRNFGRGIFITGNHAPGNNKLPLEQCEIVEPKITVPFNLPKYTLNRYTIKAFNSVYYYLHGRGGGNRNRQNFDPFFYPLDSLGNWNRIYGKEGFYQYQFVLPIEELSALKEALSLIVESGMGSFLAVLKVFGEKASPGMMSFPRQGLCLALDFSNRGKRTLALLNSLDDLVVANGGCVYPAKDSRMSSDVFKAYFPELESFRGYVDPGFNSDFWERVSGGEN